MQSKPVVLIVEDKPGIADTLQYALRAEGFEPRWCATGGAALGRAGDAALVILDVGLPDISGFELFKRLRALRDDLPVLFLTARGDEIDRVVGLELGVDDYITTPFSPREWVARVRSGLFAEGRLQSATAGGVVQGTLARADVDLRGGVRAERLRVAVLPRLESPLLGMDVLSKLRFTQSDGVLRLEAMK